MQLTVFKMDYLKKILVFFLLFIAGLLAVYLYKRYQSAPTIALFKEELLDVNEHPCNLDKYQGKPCIISFYASWCGDCIRELTDLNAIHAQLKNTSIICITDESIDKLISFKEKKNYPFLFYKTEKSFSEFDIHAIPVTYIINSKSEIVYKKVGAVNWKDTSFLQYAKNLLR
jgi:peroxiredoxin